MPLPDLPLQRLSPPPWLSRLACPVDPNDDCRAPAPISFRSCNKSQTPPRVKKNGRRVAQINARQQPPAVPRGPQPVPAARHAGRRPWPCAGARGAEAQGRSRLRFYLLFGDEYNLSAPRSGAPGGGAGGGTPPPQRFFGFERARR